MFVRLESEIIREQAMAKARGLGGKRHAIHNHKYFVSSVECEAVRAAKSHYKSKIQKIVAGNKNKEEGQKTGFYYKGEDLYIDGKLQKEFIEPPSIEDVNSAMMTRRDDLSSLKLYHSTAPIIENNNHFTAYAVRTRRMDAVRLGYIKTIITKPRANHVMMAYRVGNYSGSCDDGECQAGGRLLQVLKNKRLKNVAIYVVRESNGQHLKQRRFELIDQVATELADFLLVNSIVSDNLPPLVEERELRSSQGSNASTT